MKYILVDELNAAGTALTFAQGDTKTIYCYFQNANGAPWYIPFSVTDIQVRIQGVSGVIAKALSNGVGVLGSYIGFYFTLSATDSLNIPALRLGANVAVKIITPTSSQEIDLPGALVLTTPIV